MARQATGTIETRTLADEMRAFHLRFRANGERELLVLHELPHCPCGCGGGWDETSARTELGNVLARVRVGVWQRPKPPPALAETAGEEGKSPSSPTTPGGGSTPKIDGVLGAKPISENTVNDYRWRLRCHLLPFFRDIRLDQIDRDLCLAFKAHLLREAKELREVIDAGADIRDRRGRKAVPLAPASIRKVLDALAAILDDAVDGHADFNPARGKRMRVYVPTPRRTFLEMDELVCLLDAAAAQETQLPPGETPGNLGPTGALVAHLAAKGCGRARSPAGSA